MATLIENINRIYADKETIKQAIMNKGVTVPESTRLNEYAGLIAQINAGIDTSSVTATSSDVLAGKVIVDASGNEVTGTMTNVGAIDSAKSFSKNGTNFYAGMTKGAHITNASSGYPEISIPQTTISSTEGITANKLLKGNSAFGIIGTATADATAAAENILSGKTAYVNGSKITGTLTMNKIISDSPTVTVELTGNGVGTGVEANFKNYLSGQIIGIEYLNVVNVTSNTGWHYTVSFSNKTVTFRISGKENNATSSFYFKFTVKVKQYLLEN